MKQLLKGRKKPSLTRQIITIVSVLVIGSIAACWIMNTTLLQRFYIQDKQHKMIESFEIVSQACAEDTLGSSDFDITFENICANGNIKMLIVNSDGDVLRTSENDFSLMQQELLDVLFQPDGENVVAVADGYKLVQKTDTRLNGDYLMLVGVLDDGTMILMRTAVESIHESVQISNRFLLFVGLIAMCVSLIVGAILSRRVTKPILQLTDISKRMVNLDFDAKYVPGGWKNAPKQKFKDRISRTQLTVVDTGAKIKGNEVDQLGDHINRLSENLERTISELKSANVELQNDIEKKIQIDEMRKEFLSNVSHELKTPLALIQGYAEGLQECINDDPESRDFYCEVIIDEADKMNRMVKKLLTLNQLEFGNEQVAMERFDLTELIRGVVNASHLMMEQKGITIDLSGLDENTCAWGDEFKVEEVVTNYLSNAINHCEGGMKISMSYAYHDDLVRLSVFNTGKPIPEESLDQIWVKFYKVDKARTREYGGSGIGLSIVKAIMDSFHQKCGVINHEDGVEFWMELQAK